MVKNLEEGVSESKRTYSDALRNLEEISEAIHQKRLEMRNEAELGIRGAGVGSESPSPPPTRGKDHVAIDGQSVHLVSSCNNGDSPTTVTQAQFSVSNDTSQEFRPPSVIYSSPEKARSESYRKAIEARMSVEQSLDNISEDMTVNLDDEYMSLPSGSSPRINEDTDNVFSASLGAGNAHYIKQGKSEESSALSTSPSGQGKKSAVKLKGLILTPVGAGLDPLQASLRIQTKPNIAKARSEPQRPASYPYSHNTDKNSRVRPLEGNSSPKESGRKEVVTPGSERTDKGLLRAPSMQDFDEGSFSDNESITSGPMLDDDQVEFLTMDFSQQKLESKSPESDTKEYRRLSLPDALSYVRKVSESRHYDDKHRDSTDLTEAQEDDTTVFTEVALN